LNISGDLLPGSISLLLIHGEELVMTWFMAFLLVASFVWTGWNEFKAPILWNTPTRVDSSWFRYFPDASGDEIRYFLELVVEAFVFSQNYHAYLLPDQSIPLFIVISTRLEILTSHWK